MKTICLQLLFTFLFLETYPQEGNSKDLIIAKGQMPNIVKDKRGNIHLVYGTGDSIMYAFSGDGRSFTPPALVAILPKLLASAMRGPQIAAANEMIVITACTEEGNIFSFRKELKQKWTEATRVNHKNEVAKEALMGLASDGENTYAVWLGVRGTTGQNVYGAKSTNGGNTWSDDILVYASPDSTVCECCKPSVAVKGSIVYVMFRNWLQGSRDLYLVKSPDGGATFEPAQKLGQGSWKLNGCPMDGGGLVINKSGVAETVWRREGKIYGSTTSGLETEIGQGRSCAIESINNKNIYTWTENGNVIVLTPNGRKIFLGEGSVPVLKALDDQHVICVWENEKRIHAVLLTI